MTDSIYMSSHRDILIVEHQRLRETLHSAICWIKIYMMNLSMTLVNDCIFVATTIPDDIYGMTINLLDNCECFDEYPMFKNIEYCKKCPKLCRKVFCELATYMNNCCDEILLTPFDILPYDNCKNSLTKTNINLKLQKLEGFLRFFSEIIKVNDRVLAL